MKSFLNVNQIKEDKESLEKWGSDWTNGFEVAPSVIVFPETNEPVSYTHLTLPTNREV